MNKREWDAMDEMARNQVVWDNFPEITPSSDDWVLSTNGGKTGFNFFDTEWEAKAAIPRYAGCQFYENATVVHWRHCRNFTTDRNECALVLDKVDLPVLLSYLLAVTGETDIDIGGGAGTKAMCNLLRANPDTICYCAVKAAENGN